MADREIPITYACSVEEALKDKDKGSVWVSLVLEDRCYGGPEEGGWWYNTGDVKVQVRAFGLEDMNLATAFYKKFWNNVGRPSISSVNSCGRFGIHITDTMLESWPAERPHYE